VVGSIRSERMSLTLFDRLWNEHVVTSDVDGRDLLFIDRSLLTDLSGTVGLEVNDAAQLEVMMPERHTAIPDHVIETGGTPVDAPRRRRFVEGLERRAAHHGIEHFGRGTGRQGIVHVVGLERGITLPGLTVVCGDSHTTTHGAVGALSWGIGSTEVEHSLATQTLWMTRPRSGRIRVDGQLPPLVSAKDVALFVIGQLGAGFGTGLAVEFAGDCVESMSVESRATLCNLAIELGARFAFVAPDQTTFDYVATTDAAPSGDEWAHAVATWRQLRTAPDAHFDVDVGIDVNGLAPQITWGTSPEHVTSIDGTVPADADEAACAYMGVERGQHLSSLAVDHVFIGSCANARLSDLIAAAEIVRGRTVATSVRAWVVPGSERVGHDAERIGLDDVFRAAGFEWRAPGCSMCVGINGDIVGPGERSVSTSNRNFVGRQGPRARTHLASPVTAAASALTGFVTDARTLL
jgi:3-isopropylmalate/(R)-2-methylmalate dehydratase large subunit